MINKDKNVMLQITIPKEVNDNLTTLVKAFRDNGIPTSKSQVMVKAFNEYLKCIVVGGTVIAEGGKGKC